MQQQNTSKLVPALIGGAIIGFISGIPGLNLINCACCAGVLLGAALSVYFYHKQVGMDVQLESRDGIELGLLAGVFGAVISYLLSLVIGISTMDFLGEISNYTDDPDITMLLEEFDPAFMAKGFAVVGFVISVVINSVIGLLGGLIGVSIFGKSSVPQQTVVQVVQSRPTVEPGKEDDDIVVEDDINKGGSKTPQSYDEEKTDDDDLKPL